MIDATTKTVITVDDDPSIRLLVRAALEHDDSIHIIEASDGAAGLQSIHKYRPDLVLLDVGMPKMDGIKALTKLRSDPDFDSMPVILLTGFKDEEKLNPLLEHERTDILQKPFMLERLREKVKRVLYVSKGRAANRPVRAETLAAI